MTLLRPPVRRRRMLLLWSLGTFGLSTLVALVVLEKIVLPLGFIGGIQLLVFLWWMGCACLSAVIMILLKRR